MKQCTVILKFLLVSLCMAFSWNCISQTPAIAKPQLPKKDTLITEPRKDLTYGFSVAVGGRFRFLDKSASNDLYYDFSAFYPSAFSIGKKKLNVGIDFGLFESGLNGTPDKLREYKTLNYQIFDEPGLYKKVNEDSVLLINRTFNRQATPLKSNGIGLYFSPTVELSKKCYLLLNFQHFYHNATRSFKDEVTQSDTVKVTRQYYDDIKSDSPISSFGSDRDEESTSNRTFIGVGGIFFFNFDDVSFRIKPTIGYEFSRFTVVGNTNLNLENSSSLGKFIVDFRFIESKKYGIKIGGEIQGTVRKRRSFVAPPSIYLSKIFDLNKIIEFIK